MTFDTDTEYAKAEELVMELESEGTEDWSCGVFADRMLQEPFARRVLHFFPMFSRYQQARLLLSLVYNPPRHGDKIPHSTHELIRRHRTETVHMKGDASAREEHAILDTDQKQKADVKEQEEKTVPFPGFEVTRKLPDSLPTVVDPLVQWAADIAHQVLVFRGPLWPMESDLMEFSRRLIKGYGSAETTKSFSTLHVHHSDAPLFSDERFSFRKDLIQNPSSIETSSIEYGGCSKVQQLIQASPSSNEAEALDLEGEVMRHLRCKDTSSCTCCYHCLQEVRDHCSFLEDPS